MGFNFHQICEGNNETGEQKELEELVTTRFPILDRFVQGIIKMMKRRTKSGMDVLEKLVQELRIEEENGVTNDQEELELKYLLAGYVGYGNLWLKKYDKAIEMF